MDYLRSDLHRIIIGNVNIGGKKLIIAAGPCAVESLDQTIEIAEQVKRLGADMIRGGAFKPRQIWTFGIGKERSL